LLTTVFVARYNKKKKKRRAVKAQEALKIQLATCFPPSYEKVNETPALQQALALAELLWEHPQTCMRNDRLSTHFANPIREAMIKEFELGLETLTSGEFKVLQSEQEGRCPFVVWCDLV